MSADDSALVKLESSIHELCEIETRLAAELDLYRRTMTPVVLAAAYRITGDQKPSDCLMRQYFADTFLAHEGMKAAIKHTVYACDFAKALKNHMK